MSARLRSTIPLIIVVLGVLAAAYASGAAPEGPPLDPRSAGPSGTRALADTLRAVGAEVRLGERPRNDDTAALLLTDTLDDAEREEAHAWVRDGGVLLLTDARSELAPAPAGLAGDDGVAAPTLAADCDLAAATRAETVRPSPTSAVLRAPAGATACFPAGGGHWLVVEPDGAGARVTVGAPDVLTNARLRDAGHAVLAVGLLAPDPGSARVTIITPPRPGEGDATLTNLVPRNVWLWLAQLGLAFLLVVAWRGRRLARPASERQPVDLPASELVAATGDLLAAAGARGHAAGLLRDELRRELAEGCGLPAATSPGSLADVLVARHGAAREDVVRVFEAPDPRGDDDLIALARATEKLRRAVLHASGGDRP